MSFNGYTNYETWAVCLWIDNDECLMDYASRLGKRNRLDDGTRAESFKCWITENCPDIGATLWQDLLNASLSEVNWQEVAKQYSEEE